MSDVPRVAVFTAITGGRDVLQEEQCFEGADFLAFVDKPSQKSGWTQIKACTDFDSPRQNAKVHKILAHRYLADYDYSLWLDGSLRLLCPVRELIKRYLADADLAVFKHHCRDCLYDEAEVCRVMKLDDEETILAQVARYEAAGYPKNNGLIEAGVLLRRHTPGIERFNNLWWREICGGSIRDQISANYVLHSLGIQTNRFPNTIYSSDAFEFCGHAGEPETGTTLEHLDSEVRRLSAAYGVLLDKFERSTEEIIRLEKDLLALKQSRDSLIFTDPSLY